MTCVKPSLTGRAARRRANAEIRRVVILQCLWRRKQAVRELRGLKAEAKSASKFKEISYQLENKVVELTQNIQKRVVENRELSSKVKTLEQQLATLQGKHDEASSRSKQLEDELAKPTVPTSQFEQLAAAKAETDEKIRQSLKRVQEQEAEINRLTSELEEQARVIEERQFAVDAAVEKERESSSAMAALRSEVNSLREQISRSNALQALTKNSREPPPSPTHANGLRAYETANGERTPAPSRRRARRHSITGPRHARNMSADDDGLADLRASPLKNPRAVSVMLPPVNGIPRVRDSNGLPTLMDNSSDEIIRILEDIEGMDQDVLQGLIYQLKLPSPSLHNPPLVKEIIFPAHLISLVTNEMWKLCMIRESERFLADVMQAIQNHVMSFKGEDVIAPGIFWLTNVHEVLSFVNVAEADAAQGIGPGSEDNGRELDWDQYERLVSFVKHDLDSLEYNLYHTWMSETKKRLAKMVIPALIESQSLPGFITSDGRGQMFTRMLGSMGANAAPTATMDDILNVLNKVYKCLKSYYMEESVMQQVVTELLKLIGQIAFNDLIMRRNFCSWKRGEYQGSVKGPLVLT